MSSGEQSLCRDGVCGVTQAGGKREDDAAGANVRSGPAGDQEDDAGNRERSGGPPACGQRLVVDDPAEEAGEHRSGAEGDDRPDRDAGLVDGGEERELIAGDRCRSYKDNARRTRRGRPRGKAAGDQDEQEPADEDSRGTDGRRRRVWPKRLRGPRGAEAKGGEENENACRHHEIDELFHNQSARCKHSGADRRSDMCTQDSAQRLLSFARSTSGAGPLSGWSRTCFLERAAFPPASVADGRTSPSAG